ncbi:MAG: ATP synthase F1 subunit delta [Cyanobacteria bacterium]|nr:ATP synthase F1 subunit delta [Cyanobacteriota bacterium]
MSLRTSANRYAKALFDVALEEKADLAQIDRDLQAVADMLKTSPDLQLNLRRGSVTDAERQSLMEAIAKAMSLSKQVSKLIALLGKSGKLDLMPDLTVAYRERLLSHQNIVRADVTSAAPLSPEKTKALEESLSKVTGKKVEISVSVDPELLGGVVARIGSTVYDGSVKTQLARMRQELVKQ